MKIWIPHHLLYHIIVVLTLPHHQTQSLDLMAPYCWLGSLLTFRGGGGGGTRAWIPHSRERDREKEETLSRPPYSTLYTVYSVHCTPWWTVNTKELMLWLWTVLKNECWKMVEQLEHLLLEEWMLKKWFYDKWMTEEEIIDESTIAERMLEKPWQLHSSTPRSGVTTPSTCRSGVTTPFLHP